MSVYTLNVYPKGMGKQIYRTFTISGSYDLNDLCREILHYFDFDGDHLFLFDMANASNPYRSNHTYEAQAPLFFGGLEDPPTLDELHLCKGQKFQLLYDFGDDWLFCINVRAVSETDKPGALLKSAGKLRQYPNYDDEDDEDWEEE